MPSLKDLITTVGQSSFVDRFLDLFRLVPLPVASWQNLSFQKHTVESESTLLAALSTAIQAIAKGGFITLAGEVSDDWVDLVASEVFAETRLPAVYTLGRVRVQDTGAVGPITKAAGTFWVSNADGSRKFYNTAAFTVPLSGYATPDPEFKAETAGSAWNVGVGAITEILTTTPGLTVSNPIYAGGTWITTQGSDKEANAALVARCLAKWATLGSGSNDGAYYYNASSVSGEITHVAVSSPGGGSVRIVIAGAAGPVSSATLTAVQTKIAAKRPIGVPDVTVQNATANSVSIAATLVMTSGRDPATALAAAQAAVDAYARSLAPGAKVSREQIGKALLADGVADLESFTGPAADVTQTSLQKFVPSYSLTTA